MIGDAPSPAPPAPVAVRQAGTGDLDDVMNIMAASFPPNFGEAWTRSQCAGILPMAGVALRLARDKRGNPAGFTLMRTVADEAELLLIAVDPEVRRHGIGGALLDDFITTAVSHGARRLHLEVRDGNPAIELYQRAGFALVGRRRGYYHAPGGAALDALTLALALDAK